MACTPYFITICDAGNVLNNFIISTVSKTAQFSLAQTFYSSADFDDFSDSEC